MSDQDHILVVEDEPITREQLVSYFEEEGFRVSSTPSGNEVQKIIDETDVIFCTSFPVGVFWVVLDFGTAGCKHFAHSITLLVQRDVTMAVICAFTQNERVDHPCQRIARQLLRRDLDHEAWSIRER